MNKRLDLPWLPLNFNSAAPLLSLKNVFFFPFLFCPPNLLVNSTLRHQMETTIVTPVGNARSPYHRSGSGFLLGSSGNGVGGGDGHGVSLGGGGVGRRGSKQRSCPQPTASLETKLLEETYDRWVKNYLRCPHQDEYACIAFMLLNLLACLHFHPPVRAA